MTALVGLLERDSLLLLFLVAALGYLLGQVRVRGFGLGVAAVLFVGLGFGALSPQLKLPDFVYQFGLVLFVYTIALASGPGFFAALRRRGLGDNLLVGGVLGAVALLAGLLGRLLGLEGGFQAGLLAGALTNTPALAGVIETLQARGASAALLGQPVAAYALAYPVGVVGMLLALHLAWRVWGQHQPAEAGAEIEVRTLEVGQCDLTGLTLEELLRAKGWHVVFGRYRRGGEVGLATPDLQLAVGDRITVVGLAHDLEPVAQALGGWVAESLEQDRQTLDFRRVFLSNPKVAGRTLGELDLPRRLGVVATRIRRGDLEFLPEPHTVLELGDRVRVLGPKERIAEASRYLGDSYRALSEVDVLSFGLGIALGLLLGNLSFPIPGGSFKLGLAGGPLVVGLVLGALNRSGPVLWQLPYNANLTLRQLGVILFLAGIGLRSGYTFVQTLAQGGGLALFLTGAALTLSAAFLTLWIGHRLLGIRLETLSGLLAGLQGQPAVLAFALEKAGSERPNLGYATVYPLAMLLKILFAQLLLGGG